MRRAEIEAAFRRQAEACARLGSPFTARLLDGLAARLDPATATGAAVLDWPGDAGEDALALRLAGGLHALARDGRDAALSAVWTAADPRGPDPAATAAAAIGRHDAWLRPWLDGPPQTNETARGAALLGGLLVLAARDPRPVELLEIGASAGLNLGLDACALDVGEGRTRPGVGPDAPRIETTWRGPAPDLSLPVEIAARAGCDVAPLDPADPATRARLAAYVWADQPARLARLEAALTHAAAAGRRVERADAGEWAARRLAAPQAAGTRRVLMHSIVRQYLPAASRDRLDGALAAAGAAATPDRPLAHLRLEPDGDGPGAALTLTTWPGGRAEMLARSCFHGRWTDWIG